MNTFPIAAPAAAQTAIVYTNQETGNQLTVATANGPWLKMQVVGSTRQVLTTAGTLASNVRRGRLVPHF